MIWAVEEYTASYMGQITANNKYDVSLHNYGEKTGGKYGKGTQNI